MTAEFVLLSPEGDRDPILDIASTMEVNIRWVDSGQDVDAVTEQLQGIAAIVLTPSNFPTELARACHDLRLIQVVSAGADRIDLHALGELGIKVANNGGGNAVAVAEHTIGLIVSVYRKLQLQFASAKAGKWATGIRQQWWDYAHELTGKTVGIVGAGRIGRSVAQRLQGWDCDLIYNDVFPMPPEEEERLNIKRVSLDELLTTADVVCLHVLLNDHTRHMISDPQLEMMKPTAILINACRGPVVDEAALIRAMREGKIAGAGLDVLEQEPTPPDNPLLQMDNVLITPHLAALSQEAFEKSRRFAIENAARVAGGGEPLSVVMPE